MTPVYTQPFDELNNLRTELVRLKPLLEAEETREDATEELYELLWVLYGTAYLNGVNEANTQLCGVAEASPQRFVEQALKPIAGKTFADRIDEYSQTADIEAIYRVADTDSHRLYVEGELDTAIADGAKVKTWHTMEDFRVRDTHDYLEGVTVGIDDVFATYTGAETYYPGEFGIAEEDVNCRCWLTFDY